ncbi:MAG TPA: alpha-isopropylmalate synthase regulatory domain-containing protein, partial [Tissierellaceae bacterium]|nr:alpha-isopropylmalate synthase regulatory domain-containing protein [Tissierellaceae bacterium]
LSNRETYEIMTPESVGLSNNNLVLGKHSGRHAFKDKVVSLGYEIDDDQINIIFAQFKDLADKKKQIFDRDIEILLTRGIKETRDYYKLERFVVNSGNTITTTASVVLDTPEGIREGISFAQGPVDASFKAIEQCVHKDITLEDYSLQSITEGTDALGYAVVKLRYKDKHFVGRDASIDVVEASISAYINAVNKLMQEEETHQEMAV